MDVLKKRHFPLCGFKSGILEGHQKIVWEAFHLP